MCEAVADMKRMCRTKGASFFVVIVPAGCAYSAHGYELSDVHSHFFSVLRQEGIHVRDTMVQFSSDPSLFFTETDHLTQQGSSLLASIILVELLSRGVLKEKTL